MILVLLIIGLLQVSFLPILSIYGVFPNLVLILILTWLLIKTETEVTLSFRFFIGIIAVGLFLDLFSGLPFGLISLSLLGVVGLIDRLAKILPTAFFYKNWTLVKFWNLNVLVLATVLFYNLFILFLSKPFQPAFATNWTYYLFYSIPLEAVYSIILIWLIFYGIGKIYYQNYNLRKY